MKVVMILADGIDCRPGTTAVQEHGQPWLSGTDCVKLTHDKCQTTLQSERYNDISITASYVQKHNIP